MPKQKKDQFVIAYIANLDQHETVVKYARTMARFLGKGLILLYICDKRYTKIEADEAQQRLINIKQQFTGEDITYCVLKGKSKEIINLLPTMLNGVVAVAGVDRNATLFKPTNPHRVINDFAECKIAYLTVQIDDTSINNLKDIALRIDYRKESKEKLIWASYFARFNNSLLHILHEEYKDAGLRTKFEENMLFLGKFFAGLNVEYKREAIDGSVNFQDISAIKHSINQGYNLMICVTTDTRELDVVDWFIGKAEHRVIKNKYKIPVLFINPRDDIYVLCD